MNKKKYQSTEKWHQDPDNRERKRENNRLWVLANPEKRKKIARDSYHRRKAKS